MKIINSLIATIMVSSSLIALEPMAKESGFSGFAVLGTGYIEYKSNEVAGNKLVDLKNERITGYGTPSKQSQSIPVITGTVKYTLEDKKTEFFLGNSLEDYLRMDSSLSLGVRHKFDDIGILGIRILASVSPTKVYEDPLSVGIKRNTTERTSAGLGIKWENIMDSNFEVDIRARNIEFENDLNGLSLVGTTINIAEYKDLERDGTMTSAELLYTVSLNEHHTLVPSIKFTSNDRDGAARDYTQSEVKLSYFYFSQKWIVSTLIYAGESSYDKRNPVFDKKQDTDFLGAGVNVTYKQPFGWKHWGINAGFFASRGDSDIDFYDTRLTLATIAVAYHF